MKCNAHAEVDAVGTCVSCNRAVCHECAVEVQGRLICRVCLASGKTSSQSPSDITDNDRMMGLLAHVIQFIVPLIILLSESGKQRRFQRYHAVHSLVVSVVLWVVMLLVICLVSVFTLGYGSCFVLPLAFLPYIPAVYYGVQAYQGRYIEVPLVTDFAEGQGWV